MEPGRHGVPRFGHACFGFQGAFPDRCDAPSRLRQGRSNDDVPSDIRVELCSPEIPTCRWDCRVSAVKMSMPEAAMDEDDRIVLRQHDVRLAGYALDVQPVSEAQRMQGSPKSQFRLRALPANARHHAGSGLTVDNICHLRPGLGLWTWYTASI